jgi:hypothetical protein
MRRQVGDACLGGATTEHLRYASLGEATLAPEPKPRLAGVGVSPRRRARTSRGPSRPCDRRRPSAAVDPCQGQSASRMSSTVRPAISARRMPVSTSSQMIARSPIIEVCLRAGGEELLDLVLAEDRRGSLEDAGRLSWFSMNASTCSRWIAAASRGIPRSARKASNWPVASRYDLIVLGDLVTAGGGARTTSRWPLRRPLRYHARRWSFERRRQAPDQHSALLSWIPWARSSMAEQLTLNQRVEGSSPSGLTTASDGYPPSSDPCLGPFLSRTRHVLCALRDTA